MSAALGTAARGRIHPESKYKKPYPRYKLYGKGAYCRPRQIPDFSTRCIALSGSIDYRALHARA
eukprot:320055-Rhodomonas_salina.1